jgi:hypothetical protein
VALKKNIISSYSTAKNLLKIAEVKLSNCELEVADFRKIAIAELQSCGAIFL